MRALKAAAGDGSRIETTPNQGDVLTVYRKRAIGQAELQVIREKIEEHGGRARSRKAIATAICEEWGWRQPRGTLATRACGDLLLRLQDWGHIKLPPTRAGTGRPRPRRPVLPEDLIPLTGLEVRDPNADLDSLIVRPITPEEREGWRLYIGRYHDLGCRSIVGEHLLYAAFLGGELVALLGWASAAFRAPLRERYIGWDESTKREHLHLVADNVRFLVLPWVHVRHLASKILAYNLRRLSADWEQTWGHPIHLAESFVNTTRFRGTCYRASNWIYLGQTAGRSKRGNAYLRGNSKALYVYPLRRDARRLLGADSTSSAPVVYSVASPIVDGSVSTIGSAAGQTITESTGSARPAIRNADQAITESAGSAAAPAARDSGDSAVEHGFRASLAIVTSSLGAWSEEAESQLVEATTSSGVAITQHRAEPDELGSDGGQQAPIQGSSPVDVPKRPGRRGTNRTGIEIVLTDVERSVLERQARGLAVSHRTVVRSKTILLLAAGDTLSAVARKLGCGRGFVRNWGERFVRKRIAGLEDAERSGRPARFSPRNRSSPGQAGLRAT